jgi:hypothetical protein
LRADGASGPVSFLSNGVSKIFPHQSEGSVLSKDDLLQLDDLIGHIMVEYGHINDKDKVKIKRNSAVGTDDIVRHGIQPQPEVLPGCSPEL